jgi:thiosulfate/3-mercaptopyruvate sulfurtransferase
MNAKPIASLIGLACALVLLALPATAKNAQAPPHILLSTEEVANTPGLLLLDARDGDAYLAAHLPGAVTLDVDTLSEEREGIPNLLKSEADLRILLARAGVDPARKIVVYSGMENPAGDLKRATRLFWILDYLSYPEIAIMDGGFAKWKSEGRPITKELPVVPLLDAARLAIRPRPELLATLHEVAVHAAKADADLLDCRPPAEYAGLSKKDFVAHSGHIPGAHNLPIEDLFASGSPTLNTGDALENTVKNAAADPTRRVVTYCNSGRDATAGYFALRLLRYKNIAVYDGSMAEWAAQQQLPVK